MNNGQEIKMAGMGGQGIMLIGQLLAQAAVLEDKNVVWFPTYGPETRGGTADCTVIVSTEEIGSPVCSSLDVLIALTQPMLDKFLPLVRREGIVLVNTSLAATPEGREDCKIIGIPANDIATELGNPQVVNMVMLGAYVQLMNPVSLDSVKASMKEIIPTRNHGFIPLNSAALDRGAALIA